ncbi:MAG: hypothetical protein AB7O92_22200 [Acidimicrobiia bacterium]
MPADAAPGSGDLALATPVPADGVPAFELQAAVTTPYKSVTVPGAEPSDLAVDGFGRVLVRTRYALAVFSSSGLYAGRFEFAARTRSMALIGGSLFVSMSADSGTAYSRTYRIDLSTMAIVAAVPETWRFSTAPSSGDLLHFRTEMGSLGAMALSTGAVTYWVGPQVEPFAVPGTSTLLFDTGIAEGIVEYDASTFPPTRTAAPAVHVGAPHALLGVRPDGSAADVARPLSTLERLPLPLGSGPPVLLPGVQSSVLSTSAAGGWEVDLRTTGSGQVVFTRPGATEPSAIAALASYPRVAAWDPSGAKLAVLQGDGRLLLFAPPGSPRPAGPFSGASGEYVGITPVRALDTREGLGGPKTPLGPGGSVDVQVVGFGGIPASGVSAVAVNITGILPSEATYLSAFPTSGTVPFVSNLNLVPGAVRPNLAIVRVGDGGRITVFNAVGTTDVVLDVQGWFSTADGPAGGRFHAVGPTRALDTRETVALAAGETRLLMVRGRHGVPAGASAVAMTVIGIARQADTYVTVHPSDVGRPHASNINARGLETASNLVYSRIGSDGAIALYNAAGQTNLVVDIVGYWDHDRSSESGRYIPFVAPFRWVDTRQTGPTLLPQTVASLPAAGYPADDPRIPLPSAGGAAIVYNLTATGNMVGGYLTAYPAASGPNPPLASNINFYGGQTVAILAMTGYGEDGRVNLFNPAGRTDAIVDIAGFFTSSAF